MQVSSLVDFEVGQGIAIDNLELIAENINGEAEYTWLAAKVIEIDQNTNEIKLNRKASISITQPVTVKHDNYFIFRDISNIYNGKSSFNITIPYGEYEVNAIRNTTNSLSDHLFYFQNKSGLSIDFSGSKILLNGEIYYSGKYNSTGSRPVTFMRLTNCENANISNVDVDGGGLQARRAADTYVGGGDGSYYGFLFESVENALVENVKLSYF